MSNGHIRIPRSLLRNPLWISLKPSHKEIFLVVLDHAVYYETPFDDFGQILILQPGEFCIPLRKLLDLCSPDFSKNEIERGIKKLILCQFLRQEVRHRKSILIISHLDTYNLIIKKDETDIETNLRQTRDKLETQSNKQRKQECFKEQQQAIDVPVVVVFSDEKEEFIKSIAGISKTNIKLCLKYSIEEVKIALEATLEGKVDNFNKKFNTALKEKWVPNKPKKSIEESNQDKLSKRQVFKSKADQLYKENFHLLSEYKSFKVYDDRIVMEPQKGAFHTVDLSQEGIDILEYFIQTNLREK